jgi:23S rRNA pseudouridine955/2504/2580 synthase
VAQEIIVPEHQNGKKLESFLGRTFPIGYVRKLFRKNGVRLNGRRAKELDVLRAGDSIELFIPFEASAAGAKNRPTPPAKVEILFENPDLLVVNKPAGLTVHEAQNVDRERTLLGLLESRFRQASFRPLLVHRLDKDTSGVVVVAKNEKIAREIESRFEEATVKKEYLCLIAGRPALQSGTIDAPLPGRDGQPVRSLTHYKIDKRFFDATLVRVTIDTGRMHQIRLHFAHLGYPVVMDRQHGDFAFNKSFRKRTGLKRQFLHAARLALNLKGNYLSWKAPLPEDLRQTLEILESEIRPASHRRLTVFPPSRRGGR